MQILRLLTIAVRLTKFLQTLKHRQLCLLPREEMKNLFLVQMEPLEDKVVIVIISTL